MKNVLLAISITVNAMFVLAIIVAFKTELLTIDQPQTAMSDEQYLMAVGQAGKEAKLEIAQAKADIFSVLDKKHR